MKTRKLIAAAREILKTSQDVWISQNITTERQAFTVAHALGLHLVLLSRRAHYLLTPCNYYPEGDSGYPRVITYPAPEEIEA